MYFVYYTNTAQRPCIHGIRGQVCVQINKIFDLTYRQVTLTTEPPALCDLIITSVRRKVTWEEKILSCILFCK